MITFSQLGKYGRFGNQMFQIASTIGIAKKLGYEYGFPNWINWDAFDRFGTKENINVFEYFVNELPRCNVDLPDYPIQWGFNGFLVPDNVSISGHMQSEKYFAHCKELIKETFKMKDEYEKNDFTAIHIRLGDYGDDFHPICGMDYYKAAFDVIPGPYMVFSDDIDGVIDLFIDNFKCEKFFFYNSDTYDSFKMMKSCKNHIISNSTYSWWAAWLAGGKVVAPSKWFGSAWNPETKDIYAEGWAVI